MARLAEDAQNGKADVQRLADRVSGIFVLIVLVLSVVVLIGWLATGHFAEAAFTAAAAVLTIACPCALGLVAAHRTACGNRSWRSVGNLDRVVRRSLSPLARSTRSSWIRRELSPRAK